ncbi:MAG TPA: glycosyltransferase [Thermomicrobiales bacterium]|nr:glycosyltransferase [Thermomicrobiales bacterium]
MLTCEERAAVRRLTLLEFALTDWPDQVQVAIDPARDEAPHARLSGACHALLQHAAAAGHDHVLILEDDLAFNRNLFHNLQSWPALRAAGEHFFGTLFHAGHRQVRSDVAPGFAEADPLKVHGSLAFVMSRGMLAYALEHWHAIDAPPDLKLPRLAARRGPVYDHVPSLVQHVGGKSMASDDFHRAEDFDPLWKAGQPAAFALAPPAARRAANEVSVVWQGHLTDMSGYADETRNFVFALDQAGVDIAVAPVHPSIMVRLPPIEMERLRQLSLKRPDGPFVHISHMGARHFQPHPAAVRNIGRTMLETDSIPPSWVACCNAMDEVWVPCAFNVETFTRSGVDPAKLHRVPGAISTELYDPRLPPLDSPQFSGFVFLSVFGWSLRKGWDALIRAYVDEFSRDEAVTLVLKVFPPVGKTIDHLRRDVERFMRDAMGRDPATTPAVQLLDIALSPAEMARLYRSVNAFVMPSRGEAWGRPYMEAMAMGLPTIGTRSGGNLEFMTDANSYLIECEFVATPAAGVREAPVFRAARWAEPSVDHLRQLMRQVFEDRDDAAARGALASEQIRASFSRERVAALVIERLEASGVTVGRRAAPRVRRPTVVWHGDYRSSHSFAIVNRELCAALRASGRINLTVAATPPLATPLAGNLKAAALTAHAGQPPSDADIHVRFSWPPTFEPPPAGRLVQMLTWEFGSLPRDWIAPLNEIADEVWVPSAYIRDCFIGSGVRSEKVAVMSYGVDPARYNPRAAPLDLPTDKRFRFLFVGGTISRKNVDELLGSYLETFRPSDDVCLVIKDTGVGSFYGPPRLRERIRRLQADPSLPEILYIERELPDEQMPGLYTACHTLVHPHRAEGFGLPLLEAMACGLLVIAPDFGACLDYCDPTVARLVSGSVVQFPEPRVDAIETVSRPWWFQVDAHALANAMIDAFESPETTKEIGARAAERVRRQFSWDQAAEIASERLERLATRPVWRSQRQRTGQTHPADPTISVCMIVKDEEEHLSRCLESVHGLTDEIIVVDTGSTDNTVSLARRHGARVFNARWIDDWAAARNASLQQATKDWILVLDADQTLDPGSHAEIRRLIAGNERAGYLLRQLNYQDNDGRTSIFEHLTVRLFPNRPDIRYAGRIHEQVVSLDPDRKLELRPTSVIIHHYGYLPEIADPRRKLERDLPVLEALVRDEPNEPFHAFNLGVTYNGLGRYEDAIAILQQATTMAVAQAAGSPPMYVASAYVTMALALIQLGHEQTAADACRRALAIAPRFSDAWCALGVVEARQGRLTDALEAYRRALDLAGGAPVVPTDRSTSGWKALLGIGEVLLAQDNPIAARERLEQAGALSPGNPAIERALGQAHERVRQRGG